MLVLLRKHFLLTRMRNVSSAAVMSAHAWDGETFGKPRDLLNLDVLQRSGWTGPGSVRWNAFKNCWVSVQAIKVTLCSCGENWARHLFRGSESAVGFTSFSVWERGSALKCKGNYFCKSQIINFFFGSDTHKLDPLTWGDEIERNPLCFLISQRERKSMSMVYGLCQWTFSSIKNLFKNYLHWWCKKQILKTVADFKDRKEHINWILRLFVDYKLHYLNERWRKKCIFLSERGEKTGENPTQAGGIAHRTFLLWGDCAPLHLYECRWVLVSCGEEEGREWLPVCIGLYLTCAASSCASLLTGPGVMNN